MTALLPPVKLADRYEVSEVLASGGMGAVYLAHDHMLERDVAVKMVTDGGMAARRFSHEVQVLARLNHPHVVRLYDAGDHDGWPYLVMEYVRGHTLRERLARGPLSGDHSRDVGAGIATALAHAHSLGVMHRDVKPENLLCADDGCVRLSDFGVARFMDATGTAEHLGTPAYVAPEQLEGGQLTSAVDVYALGLVLLECLMGRRAFPGTPTEAGPARLARDPEIPDWLGREWHELLRDMTARDPVDRPSALAVARRLPAEPRMGQRAG